MYSIYIIVALLDNGSYTLPCRCSGEFVITEQDLENAHNVVCCTNCTLSVRVLYTVASDDGDTDKQE